MVSQFNAGQVFHHDKKFVFDGVLDSKDVLAVFSNDFYVLERNARRDRGMGRQSHPGIEP